MAERVRRVGGTTIRSISHIGQLQTIEDENSDVVQAGEMVRILMKDNGHIAKMIRAAITVCENNRDTATSNQLEDILDKRAPKMVPLRSGAGIKEYRIIQLVNGHTIGAATIFSLSVTLT